MASESIHTPAVRVATVTMPVEPRLLTHEYNAAFTYRGNLSKINMAEITTAVGTVLLSVLTAEP